MFSFNKGKDLIRKKIKKIRLKIEKLNTIKGTASVGIEITKKRINV